RCAPPCEATCSQPFVNAWNEPCASSCGDSRAVAYVPPAAATFPGPITSSCPQESFVGTAVPEPEGATGFGGGGMGFGGGANSYGSGGSYG
ncbi:KRFB protein, partial [Casuarius casuarius]|nr:KRFB protein [Casuarius casuarius]